MAKIFKVLVVLYLLAFGTHAVNKYLTQQDSSIGADIDYKTALLQLKVFEMNHAYSSEPDPAKSGI